MKHRIIRAAERGLKDIGWLQSNFTFSFSSYQNPERNGFGLLRVFNDDFVQAGGGFGIHPHANMEIISVMLAGKMNHIDSLGYKEVVERDWVQIMSAGSGLRHEEHNVGDDEVNFLQIWIEPKLQNVTPRYQRRSFPEEKRRNQLTTVVSNEEGQAHCWINQNARLSLGYFDSGQQLTYTLNPTNKAVFVFVMDGALTVNGQALAKRDSIGLWETDAVQLECRAESRFIVIEAPINH
ncbi:pirin family protein [Hymenobacter busanensis]|uniref:Pirin family protein n=1 Tax=Hymenobacter busanensis TaxID=2607656 RepID=A0A7L4ZX58_9BACT|nr:pirin family protein [Hymenobacter busanensis]KAA9332045.1 pirin family protein [Hymenobacter busanensis]QHJ07617.1 pirin family protein [Hymenobacter busanensis]